MKSVSFDESGSHPASSNQFENAYSATKGWDFATGVGTLNADAPRIFISNADGSAERPLTEPGSMDYNPSWSQNGDWIVFTSERGGSADLYRVHPDGTGIERLTDAPVMIQLLNRIGKSRKSIKTERAKDFKVFLRFVGQ